MMLFCVIFVFIYLTPTWWEGLSVIMMIVSDQEKYNFNLKTGTELDDYGM